MLDSLLKLNTLAPAHSSPFSSKGAKEEIDERKSLSPRLPILADVPQPSPYIYHTYPNAFNLPR